MQSAISRKIKILRCRKLAPGAPNNRKSAADRATRQVTGATLATVEAIFNLGTLGRNDTSATPMSDLSRGGIP
jgi:hypothetical protein